VESRVRGGGAEGEDRKHLYGELWGHYFYYFFGIIFRLSFLFLC
jgi:hypothetical protein